MNGLPPSWAAAPLRSAGPVFGGGTPDTANGVYWDGDIPWVSSQDVRGRSIVRTSRSITAAGLTGSSAQMAQAGDLAFVMRSGILRHTLPVGVLAVDAAVNQDIKVLRPTGPWLAPYVAYFVEGLQRELLGEWRAEGTTVESLRLDLMLRTPLPVPPKSTQRAIIDFLDRETEKIDALVAKKQRLIELLQEKRTALISHAVTKGLDHDVPVKNSGIEWPGDLPRHWVASPLMRLVDPKRPIMYGIVLPGPDFPGGVPIVKGGDVSPERLVLEQLNRTDPEIESKYVRSRLAGGDIVYAIRGSIGAAAVVPEALAGANLTQDTARVAPRSGVEVGWLMYALQSSPIFAQLEAGAVGATIRGINIFSLKRAVLPVPPHAEQVVIGEHLDAQTHTFDKLQDSVSEAIERLREYRSTLITAAVTGQIDVGAR